MSARERHKRRGDTPYYGASGVIDTIDGHTHDGRFLLVAEDGENLRSRKTPIAFIAEGRFWANNHVHVLKVLVSRANDKFLCSYIENSSISGWVTGAAQPKLSQSNLVQIPIPVPPLPVQTKIAAVLAAYDDVIENNVRRIEILEEMALAVYREWFVNFRFPGHHEVTLVDSPLGKIPDGWEVSTLGEKIELAYGKALRADSRKGGPAPVLGSSGVVGWHDEPLVDGPGIVVGRKGIVGSVHWVDVDFYPIDTTFYVVSELSLRYLFYNLRDQHFINSDAAVPGLNRSQAYSNLLLVPASSILNQFDGTIAPISRLARNLEAQNSNLRSTRDLLLPKLLSGEVDVSDLDIDSEGLAS